MAENMVAASPDAAPFPTTALYSGIIATALGIIHLAGFGNSITQLVMALSLGLTVNFIVVWKFFPDVMPSQPPEQGEPTNRQQRREQEKKEKKAKRKPSQQKSS